MESNSGASTSGTSSKKFLSEKADKFADLTQETQITQPGSQFIGKMRRLYVIIEQPYTVAPCISAPSSNIVSDGEGFEGKILKTGKSLDPTPHETEKDTASLVKEDISDVWIQAVMVPLSCPPSCPVKSVLKRP